MCSQQPKTINRANHLLLVTGLLATFACSSYAKQPTGSEWDPMPIAGDTASGYFSYEVLDSAGQPTPCRFTFISSEETHPNLFKNQQAAPDQLAVREHVFYSLSGKGTITVPPGKYQVWVSKGMEYSVSSRVIEFREGSHAIWTPTLEREVDTTGWVSGDFHLHTLTHSGHGDTNMPERMISLIGEGVEFAVATDHNHNTDYRPTLDQLGVPDALRAITGNEVSTPIGHFNAFPLDPSSPVMEDEIYDAHELFKLIREQDNPFNTTPVVQVNHPRWGNIDYFGQFDFHPVTAESPNPMFSYDFDSVEIFNENEGWGYIDADESDLEIGSGTFSVLRDWFNLLNHGHRIAAVGNSDSHDVASELAGWPRNMIVSSTDLPSEIDPAEIAANIRNKRVYTTFGPIVDFHVNDVPMGGDCLAHPFDSTIEDKNTHADAGWVDVSIRVQVPSWIDCDRVIIIVNGEQAHTIPVKESTDTIRLDTTQRIQLKGDSWISLLVEGDTPLDPIVQTQGRPIYPWAVLNPVWVDVNRDGRWDSPVKQAQKALWKNPTHEVLAKLKNSSDAQWVNTLVAATMSKNPPEQIIRAAMNHSSRHVKLAAMTALEQNLLSLKSKSPELFALTAQSWITPLQDFLATTGDDQHLFIRTLLTLHAAGDKQSSQFALRELLTSQDSSSRPTLRNGFNKQLMTILGGSMISNWSVTELFMTTDFPQLKSSLTPPELSPSMESYLSEHQSRIIRWVDINADQNGFVNLHSLQNNEHSADNSITTARIWFESDGSPIDFTFGADDASRIILNGEIIYEEYTAHAADPLQHIGRMHPKLGTNQLLVTVENGSGGYGFYLRIFDEQIVKSISTEQPTQ